MKFRRVVATVMVAVVFFWAPSLIPIRVTPAPVRVALLLPVGCGIGVVWRTADTASAAGPIVTPCPIYTGPTPWPVIVIGAGVISVMLNALIVSNTQCRELTNEEAISSVFLPFLGIAFNKQMNHCLHGHH